MEKTDKVGTNVQVNVNGKEINIQESGDTSHNKNVNIHIGK